MHQHGHRSSDTSRSTGVRAQRTRDRLAHAARFGLAFGLAVLLAQLIDATIFHCGYLDGRGLDDIVTSGISLALAIVCLALIGGLAALALRAVRRNRPARGPNKAAHDGP